MASVQLIRPGGAQCKGFGPCDGYYISVAAVVLVPFSLSWFLDFSYLLALHGDASTDIEAAYAVGGLPPLLPLDTMVRKSEKAIWYLPLTVWPPWWLAWETGEAGGCSVGVF